VRFLRRLALCLAISSVAIALTTFGILCVLIAHFSHL
jgi:hypothetical protein